MSTIVSPEQQWKSLGTTNGFDRDGDHRDERTDDRDVRYAADARSAAGPRFDGPRFTGYGDPRVTDRFPVGGTHYRSFPVPVSRVEPAYDTPAGSLQPVDTAAAVRPAGRFAVVDQGRFWVGAVLTSGVAALSGVIGLVIAQDLLKVPVGLASIGLGGAHVGTYGLLAALVAMLAALAYDGMLAFAPRPAVYYGWLTGLLVALAVLLPFAAPVAIGSQLALALVNLVVGVSIMVLVPVAASNARNR
ncbi:hypothetical protein [Nakamurella deserti]|uniref:hypothetical protein n=1 Tax=Nakamurella deserti TaxID=2164074 RepID=UPI000DBE3DB1|nr:hypothetical protein [Nakamurella deserti]